MHRTAGKIIFLIIFSLGLGISLLSCGGGGGGGDGMKLYSISGRVNSGGSELAGVNVNLSGALFFASSQTDANGNYQFSNVPNGSYSITPSKAGYSFNPANRSVSVNNANVAGQDFSATPTRWAKTFGDVNNDIANFIQQTSDGGFILAGETYSFGVVNADVWVFKLDADGAIQWEKTFGGGGYDIAHCVQQTSDGGYIVAGETSSFGINTDALILKLDGSGNIQWQYRYGGTGTDKAYSIQQTPDGGYIVAGETTSFGAKGIDAWILRLNSNGGVAWGKMYGGDGDEIARSVNWTADDGFIVAGETNSLGAGFADFWVMKLKANGDYDWQKTYGGANDDFAHFIEKTTDGGYIVAGQSFSFNALGDMWVLKLKLDGSIDWQRTYYGVNPDAVRSIQKTPDGGYIIAGNTTSFGNVLGDMWVLKLNSNGDIDWQKGYGGQYSNSANFIMPISEGGYILAGETSFFGAGRADAWVMKLDENGNVSGGCQIISATNGTATATNFTEMVSSLGSANTSVINTQVSVSVKNSTAVTKTQCSYP